MVESINNDINGQTLFIKIGTLVKHFKVELKPLEVMKLKFKFKTSLGWPTTQIPVQSGRRHLSEHSWSIEVTELPKVFTSTFGTHFQVAEKEEEKKAFE